MPHFCTRHRRFLIAKRSKEVEQPLTWGGVGGAIDSGEDPAEAVEREVYEEAGYAGELKLVPLFIFKSGTFRYYNFLAVVDHEFEPLRNWETVAFRWFEWGQFPHPMHFGLRALIHDRKSAEIMRKYADEAKAKNKHADR